MSGVAQLGLFEGHGIEIEYAIVDRESFDVRPIADLALADVAGRWAGDYDDGDIGWSNELVAHQIELKTAGAPASLANVAASFERSLRKLGEVLARHGARALPGGMHPWMVPAREARLWSHAYRSVYRAFDRLFDCRRHGWANVQSTHLNLPFRGDDELGRLHAAVRVLLPLVPALGAASPIVEGRVSGFLDSRLEHYRTNSTLVPSLTGQVIPEPLFDEASYRREILERIRRDLAPHDPGGVLAHEWANARGAIVRFDRHAIEIRLLDAQETPRADLALCAALTALARALVEERWVPGEALRAIESAPLVALLRETGRVGMRARVEDPRVLAAFGRRRALPAGELWTALVDELLPAGGAHDEHLPYLRTILGHGTLAERLLALCGPEPSRERLREVWGELARCLDEGRQLVP